MLEYALAPLPLVRQLQGLNVDALLTEWRWRFSGTETPLFVTALADWVFGKPDGSLWLLDSLEGDYRQIATSSADALAGKFTRGSEETSRSRTFGYSTCSSTTR
jgi:hypothetical protein